MSKRKGLGRTASTAVHPLTSEKPQVGWAEDPVDLEASALLVEPEPEPEPEPKPEPEPEPELEEFKSSHLRVREHREACLNAFYDKYRTKKDGPLHKTPEEVRELVRHSGAPTTPPGRYLVLGKAAVRVHYRPGAVRMGDRLCLGEVALAIDERTDAAGSTWIGIARPGVDTGWVSVRSKDPEDFEQLDSSSASSAEANSTTAGGKVKHYKNVQSTGMSSRASAKNAKGGAGLKSPGGRPRETADVPDERDREEKEGLGRLLLEKIPDGRYDALPRRFKHETTTSVLIRSGAALNSKEVSRPNKLEQGDEVFALERQIVWRSSLKTRQRLDTATARVGFARKGKKLSWVNEDNLQLQAPPDTWFEELCAELEDFNGNVEHESPEAVLESKKKTDAAKKLNRWGKMSAQDITVADKEARRRWCCCCKGGKAPESMRDLIDRADGDKKNKKELRGFCAF